MLDIYNDLAQELFNSMLCFHHPSRNHEKHEGIFGEQLVLYHLSKCGITVPSGISEATGVSTARTAATLNSLEEKGFVTREIDKADRRKIIVTITPDGIAELKKFLDEQHAHMAKMLERLGEKDAREYVRIMGRISQIKSQIHDGGCEC